MIKWISLCLGTLIGGVSRYVLAGFVYQSFGSGFPYGTLMVKEGLITLEQINVIMYRANNIPKP